MNTNVSLARITAAAALSLFAATASAQAPVRPPYGPGINLETAKKIAAGAAAEAKKNNWNMAVAIVDNHGMLIYYEIADDTQNAAATVASVTTCKACSYNFRPPLSTIRNSLNLSPSTSRDIVALLM